MPSRPPRICPRCRRTVPAGPCPHCAPASRRKWDSGRGGGWARGYDAAWQATRAAYLATHPYCECEQCAVLPAWQRPAAEVVDHIDGLGPRGPHGHDPDNLMAMTARHHNRKTARHDGAFGRPINRKPTTE